MPSKKRRVAEKSKDSQVSFLGFSLNIPDRKRLRDHILLLIGLSLLTKLLILWATPSVFHSFIDMFDINYYFQFALKIFQGKIPYADFTVDYPQLSLVSILIPFIVALLFNNAMVYFSSHQVLMTLFDIGTTVLVYLIGLRLYDERRAYFCGILYATAFSAAYFVLTKYDSYPTFFLLLSVALFIYGRETGAYLAGAWGFLVKWFPVLALPYFLILDLKKGVERKVVLQNLGLAILLVLVVTVPFLVMSPEGFLRTYTLNTQFNTLTHGFIYYLDFITKTLTGATVFSGISLLLAALAELGLLYWYYRRPGTDYLTLCVFILFAVSAFILTNKIASPQYLQWIAPLAALFLAGSALEALLFYIAQFWWFLEFPVLYNVIYNNIVGYGPAEAGFPIITFLFFTVKFALIFTILWVVAKKLPAGSGTKAPKSG
jgi:hypothetical protein